MTSFAEAKLRQWQDKVPALLEACQLAGFERLGGDPLYHRAMRARQVGGLATHAFAEILVSPQTVDVARPGAILLADLRIVLERYEAGDADHRLACRLWPEDDGMEVITKDFEDSSPAYWQLRSPEGVDLFGDRYAATLRWFVGEEYPGGVPYQ